MATPDRFTEGFSGVVGSNIMIFLWKSGDLHAPGPLKRPVYWALIALLFFSLYWTYLGIHDRYGHAATGHDDD